MNVAIPAKFENYAREQVKAGIVASEKEAVAAALRDYLADVFVLKAAIDEGIASLDRGEGSDAEAFMRELLVETKALSAASLPSAS